MVDVEAVRIIETLVNLIRDLRVEYDAGERGGRVMNRMFAYVDVLDLFNDPDVSIQPDCAYCGRALQWDPPASLATGAWFQRPVKYRRAVMHQGCAWDVGHDDRVDAMLEGGE